MKISNNVNTTALFAPQSNNKNKKENWQVGVNHIEEQSVKISISDEGKEYYRKSIPQNEQDIYDTILQQREQLKKVRFIDYGYEIQKRAVQQNKDADNTERGVLSITDKANSYVKAYAELYDEIVQGYENGTREMYAANENGIHRLTKDEELNALDTAYKKNVDNFVTMEKKNQHAREIINEEMNKISKITSRSTLAATYIEEQKTRGEDEIPENLGRKMYDAIILFKEKYAIGTDREQTQLAELMKRFQNFLEA